MRFLAPFILALTLAGCALIPQRQAPFSLRSSCDQALKMGWCYDSCAEKPAICCQPANVRCSGGICAWEGCGGALVVGLRSAAPAS